MSARLPRAVGAVLALLLTGTVLAGCTVGQPDAKGWTEIARTSLTDAAGEVATARLTLAAVRDDEVWHAYAVTVTADVEKQVATAEESLSTAQPPAGLRERAAHLLTVLGDAAELARAARVAAVDEEVDAALLRRLADTVTTLEREAERL